MSAEIAHGGGVRAAARRYGGDPADWLDLSTGINPVPPALPSLDPAVWTRLPEPHLVDKARQTAADFYGADIGQPPLPVPGTQSVIQLLPTLAGGGRAAIVGPTYGEYALVLRRAGVPVDDIAGLDQINDGHRLAVVVNPNNPDGQVLQRSLLIRTAERMSARGGFLIVDEAFADADPAQALAGKAGQVDGLIVFRSFGKFFGLAGLRLGFVFAAPETLELFRRRLGPWAVSGPALAIAGQWMADKALVRRIKVSIEERHDAMRSVLDRAGLEITGGTELFFLVTSDRAASLHEELCRRRILVRAFDYAPNWLRIGLAPDAASERRLAEAFAEIFAEGRGRT